MQKWSLQMPARATLTGAEHDVGGNINACKSFAAACLQMSALVCDALVVVVKTVKQFLLMAQQNSGLCRFIRKLPEGLKTGTAVTIQAAHRGSGSARC